MARPRILLSLLALLVLLTTACKNRHGAGPIYPPVEELSSCRANECAEAELSFRHWANAEHYRGRIPYHCDLGSELDGPPDPAVTRMILAIHGVIGPDFAKLQVPPGLQQLRAVQNGLRKAWVADPSLDRDAVAIIAPSFQRTREWQPYTDEDRRMWTWSGANYKIGADSAQNTGFGGAVKADRVSAFDVLDEFLRAGLIKFPNLEQIVVVGHSAGGQTAHRYAMLGVGVHEHIENEGVGIRYMPANPGYYTFPMMTRKLEPGTASVRPGPGFGDTQAWRWQAPRGCEGYDDYAYGLGGLTSTSFDRTVRAADYAIEHYLRPVDRKLARRAREQPGGQAWATAARVALRMQYASREIWHFQATSDHENTFAGNCRTQVQGRSRYERFLHFQEAWTHEVELPAPGLHFIALDDTSHHHSSRVVYATEAGMHVLFR